MLKDERIEALRRWIRQPRHSQESPCVSIYMPVDPIGPRMRNNAIRLKNLLRQAEQRLADRGATSEQIERQLARARALLSDPKAWNQARRGLALLIRDDEMIRYDSPKPFVEAVHVDEVPHVKPLFRDRLPSDRFHVLTLCRDDVVLLLGDAESLEPLVTPDIPRRIEDALGEEELVPTLQQRSVRMGLGQSGKAAMFHGHGTGVDDVNDEMTRFLRHVDRGVLESIVDPSSPLVLVGVQRNVALYRRLTAYPRIVGAHIEGDPAAFRRDELHAAAWALVLPYLRASELEARRRFRSLYGTPRTTTDLEEVLGAAEDGRIATLFAVEDDERRGYFDPDTRVMRLDGAPDAVDLVELAVAKALVQDAEVFTSPRRLVPGGGVVAATYRY